MTNPRPSALGLLFTLLWLTATAALPVPVTPVFGAHGMVVAGHPEAAQAGLEQIAMATALSHVSCVVGLPLRVAGRLYNCAALLSEGRIAGVVPKTYLPTAGEFYEQRW